MQIALPDLGQPQTEPREGIRLVKRNRPEEKRMPLEEHQYIIAEELDPKDPTPWFYDAIAKQTTNRPVESLQEMQKAIELNDNRVVYRSRLSLDSDLAARSASLARVYAHLGFQQLALVEGWKSVNTDPTNYSAHRFLARHPLASVDSTLPPTGFEKTPTSGMKSLTSRSPLRDG